MADQVKTVAPQFTGIYLSKSDRNHFNAKRPMPAHCKVERRIVWNLLKHLNANGWLPHVVFDGEDQVPATTPEAAMDAIFSVDDSTLILINANDSKLRHGVQLIGGNGVDIISDYNYSADGSDNFEAVMEAFNAEDYE
jgi:hypothetical protein